MSCLEFKRGDTWTTLSRWKDSNKPGGLEAGCSVRMHVRSLSGDAKVLDLSSVTGEMVIDADDNSVAITVAAEVTKEVPLGRYVSDIEMTWPDGYVLSTGTFNIRVVKDETR